MRRTIGHKRIRGGYGEWSNGWLASGPDGLLEVLVRITHQLKVLPGCSIWCEDSPPLKGPDAVKVLADLDSL